MSKTKKRYCHVHIVTIPSAYSGTYKPYPLFWYYIHINWFFVWFSKITDVGSFRTVIRQVYDTQGARGFWRGNGLNLLKSSPEFAIKLSVYDLTKRQLKASRDDGHLSAIDRFVAGSTAGVIGQTLLYPLDARNTAYHLSTHKLQVLIINYNTTVVTR